MSKAEVGGSGQIGSTCDVLVVGSGAGGLATAIRAKALGLDVMLVEKDEVLGGTTALSGGALWIPRNRLAREQGVEDSLGAALSYMRSEAGEAFDAESAQLFLSKGPEMVDWFEQNTQVRFMYSQLPDYHPDAPGGVAVGRTIMARPYDSRQLGAALTRLRKPLRTITFLGMMFNSSNEDLKHFFHATRSLRSFLYVVRRLALHALENLRYRRAVHVTTGNALVARLLRSALDLGIPMHTATPVTALTAEAGKVTGAVLNVAGKATPVSARLGVVLACGGFPQDHRRQATIYPHVARGSVHVSPAPAGNTGDGLALAESQGGQVATNLRNPAAWIPVSRVPLGDGTVGVFPHLQDRYKPGVIAVTNDGRRFCNEATSYHDVGERLIDVCRDKDATQAWLLCDHKTVRRYGLGFAKPTPVPLAPYVASGYLKKGRTLAELATAIGVPPDALARTVAEYNRGAEQGEDRQFGRGDSPFGRYLGDPTHAPNPCVAPIDRGPYYAVKLEMGDLGTFAGLRTTPRGQVLDAGHVPIPGLYAAGNDRASVMGGSYPGGGITLGPAMTFGYVTAETLAAHAGLPVS